MSTAPASSPDEEPSYVPLFVASAKTTLVAVAAQLGLAVIYGRLAAADVTVHAYKGVLPYLRITTSNAAQFATIVRWSAFASCAVIFTYAALAMLRGQRLQVQMGRSFGYLDIALIGAVNVLSGWFLERSLDPQRWMYSLIPIGLVTFATCAWLIYDEYSRRLAGADELSVAAR